MTTNFSNIKPLLDVPVWENMGLAYLPTGSLASMTAGVSLCDDKRLSAYRYSDLWLLQAAAVFMKYDCDHNGWMQYASPALAGTFGTGASCVFAPSQGPRGLIAAGASTTKITLSAALPNSATVRENSLKGIRIRIIGNNAGGSGLTQEKTILANTAGTTPTITLDSALTFTPGTNSSYELLSGRVFLLGAGTVAANIWKYFDVGTTVYNTSALSTTNLPATISTDSAFLCLDELHTPITGVGGVTINGETGGFFGSLTATASAATTLTGQAASGDASVLLNEYRNFQIRIIEDTVNPTAVGQRRRITSHTAGASPVYTVPAWTVTPSANAKYYIENNNDILLWTSATTTTYRYDAVANTWDTTTYAVKPGATASGTCAWQPFNRVLDADKNVRHSQIYAPRGGGTATMDMLDIAGATTGTWTSDIAYKGKGLTLWNTGGSAAYAPVSNSTITLGIAFLGAQVLLYEFDNDKIELKPYASVPQIHGTAINGNKLAAAVYVDGTDKKDFVYNIPNGQSMILRSLVI